MNTLRPIELTRAWMSWPKGHVFTAMPAAQAQLMVDGGQARYADKDIARSPLNRMMKPPVRKRA